MSRECCRSAFYSGGIQLECERPAGHGGACGFDRRDPTGGERRQHPTPEQAASPSEVEALVDRLYRHASVIAYQGIGRGANAFPQSYAFEVRDDIHAIVRAALRAGQAAAGREEPNNSGGYGGWSPYAGPRAKNASTVVDNPTALEATEEQP